MHRIVPELIIENYRAGRFGGEFDAIGMFLDLSGFSTMTDTLMQHGQHGAEVLASLMHGVFNPLVESIFDYGGKIVSFAGDGIMALYPIVDGDEKQTALRALASAWVIQQRLVENPDRRTMYGNFTFSAKIGLAMGPVSWKILRSNDETNATYYFRGLAVDEAAKAEHASNAGEIILTEGLKELVDDDVRTRPNESHHRFIRFKVEIPKKANIAFPPVDLEASRKFMPEEVIVEGVQGEFRQITNLFIRIPEISDEELKIFVNEIFNLRETYGGLVTRIDFGDKGCNMLLLWGAPRAYENDIGRALNFILSLKSRMKFPITAGVTYYIAHAGYLGSELCEDYTCYGWGVNLAARFMMNAPDGAIWVDDRIAQRVSQRFMLDNVGSQRFKGFAAEQKVYALKYRKTEADVLYQGEMVGRNDEIKQLEEFVRPLWDGKFAGVATVSGEAGIGKGRLVYEFSKSELFKSHEALWANCKADQIFRQSFNPIRGWLLQYFGILEIDNLEDKKKVFDVKVDGLLASISDPELESELKRTRSFLGALADLYWDDSLYSQLDGEARYNNTILALIALLKAQSLGKPVLLFVDDFQFVDEDTLVFLTQLKRALVSGSSNYPIAIILTRRKQVASSSVTSELSDIEIMLVGVSRPEITKLAENILGGKISLGLMQLILIRSEGNPYFAEQVLKYLQEENQLEQGEDGWDRPEHAKDAILPSDIRAVLVARLDRLAREVKSIVQTASVLGREFNIGVLSQMLGSESTTKEYVTVAEKEAIWSLIGEALYIFYHGLLRDAAYSMQMRARRKELHILALNALELLYEDEPDKHYAELAYHAEQGDSRVKAQRYYALAGKTSGELYRNAEAIDYYTKALALADLDDLEDRFDLLAARVELYSRMGNRKLQSNDLDSLEQIAERINDSERLAKVLMFRSAYSYFIGNYQESIDYAAKAEATSESLASTEQAIYTQVVWSTSLLRLGRFDEAMQRAKVALQGQQVAENQIGKGRILNVMGLIALEQSDPTPAIDYFSEALRISREFNIKDVESKSLSNLAMAEVSINGNYSLAHNYYNESLNIAREIGDRAGESASLGNLGFSAGALGDFQAARSYQERALLLIRETGNRFLEIITLVNLSSLAGIQGDAETALGQAKIAAELSKATSEPSGQAWALLYMGNAYLLKKEYELAQTVFKRSIEIRNDLNQQSLSMEPRAGLVETYMAMNDPESAAQEVEKIIQFIDTGSPLEGTDEPLRVYFTCYRFLAQKKDPRSSQILQFAKSLLKAQVSKFSNDIDRDRYVNNIPWRRAIWEASLP